MKDDLVGIDYQGRNSGTETLSEWMVSFSRSDDYKLLVARFGANDHVSITSSFETAMIYAIIRRLRPELTLEIGTFFARTTRIMAEAIVDGGVQGRLMTLDPFGEHRVPGILDSWPEPVRAVTDFLPWNSMQYFLELETLGTPRGASSPLSVIFVDGHHNFEYALFDIIRSADHLSPDGAIIIDNLEQQGPMAAVIQFLSWNPAWSIFFNGSVFSKRDIRRATFGGDNDGGPCWGVLLPPAGLQVSSNVVKVMKRGIPYVAAGGLHLNLRYSNLPGKLHLNFVYYATPYDYHITGTGMSVRYHKSQVPVPALSSQLEVRFFETLLLDLAPQGANVCYEAELWFEGENSDDAYILLDAEQPFALWSARLDGEPGPDSAAASKIAEGKAMLPEGEAAMQVASGLVPAPSESGPPSPNFLVPPFNADQAEIFLSALAEPQQMAQFIDFVITHLLSRDHQSIFWGDRLLTIDKSAGFLQDPAFRSAFEQIHGAHKYDEYNSSVTIAWRLHTLVWAARAALALPEGDFVECGVFNGDMSWMIAEVTNFATTGRHFHLYDSFQGFDPSQTSEVDFPGLPGFLDFANAVYNSEGLWERVQARFRDLGHFQLHKGYLPGTLDRDGYPDRIAYLHIDLNVAPVEIACLNLLYDRVVPGGIIVFDDYGWQAHRRQKDAEDAFFAERGYHILELPTGQGLVVKRQD